VAETWWNEELFDGSDGFLAVDGVRVALLNDMEPDATYTVDYRVGKTKVFEPYLSDIDYLRRRSVLGGR
jgi:hypothetical protein